MNQTNTSRKTYDCAIIGAGVLGLWAARHAIRRGESTILIEKRCVGAGASGGFLGALMPHMPDNWNEKKQFQYLGLSSIGDAIEELEADTGIDCGFRRCGRILPLTHAKLLPQVERRLSGARNNWKVHHTLEVAAAKSFDAWLNPELAVHGVQHDTLSARINPRAYLKALEMYARRSIEIVEEAAVESILPGKTGEFSAIRLMSGDRISAGRVVVANGWEAYSLLQPVLGFVNKGNPLGRGVKGQAVLVKFDHDDALPIVYHDGIYVVPHAGNRVAIGSTSHNQWSGEPDAFDPEDMGFYEKAVAMVPALKDASIVERWAGVRPRNTIDGRGTAPWFGPVPEFEGVVALIGGFKITLGIAHLAGERDF